RDRWRG
ncbi:DNA polymerase III subunit alpha, partial [Haemophilus influenzae]